MEQVSRMAAEVNKLIGSSILSGKGVYLPGIGSLITIVNSEGIKRIDFSSSEQGESLINIIKERAACTPEQAHEIYKRWKEELHTPESTRIAEVGELRQKSFVTLESFSKQLNKTEAAQEETKQEAAAVVIPTPAPAPAPKITPKLTPKPAAAPKSKKQEPKKEEEKKRRKCPVLLIIIILLLGIAAYFAYVKISESNAEKARIEEIAAAKAAEQQRQADSLALAEAQARKQAETEATQEPATLRYRVVYGVYTLRSNVDEAIRIISKKYGSQYGKEYPYADKTMVSMFESNDRQECQRFLMTNYDEYPDTWIYDSER